MAGYGIASTIKELTSDDLVKLEIFGRKVPKLISSYVLTSSMDLNKAQQRSLYSYFLGLDGFQPSKFKFKCGDTQLLFQIVSFVNANESAFSKLEANIADCEDFDIDGNCITEETPIGVLFIGSLLPYYD